MEPGLESPKTVLDEDENNDDETRSKRQSIRRKYKHRKVKAKKKAEDNTHVSLGSSDNDNRSNEDILNDTLVNSAELSSERSFRQIANDVKRCVTYEEMIELVPWELGVFNLFIYRTEPASYKGVPTRGKVGAYETGVSLDFLADQHGGGSYHAQLYGPNYTRGGSSKLIYKKMPFNLPGVPKLHDGCEDITDEHSPRVGSGGREDPGLVRTLVKAQYEEKKRAEEKLEQERQRRENTTGMAQADVLGVMKDAFAESARARIEASQTITELYREQLKQVSDKVDKAGNGENMNAEIIKTLLLDRGQRGVDELREINTRHVQEMQLLREQHKMEMDNLRMMHETQVKSLESASGNARTLLEVQIHTTQAQLQQRENEIQNLRAQIETLRDRLEDTARSQRSELESIERIGSTWNALRDLFGPKEDMLEDLPDWGKVLYKLSQTQTASNIASAINTAVTKQRPQAVEPVAQRQIVAAQAQQPQAQAQPQARVQARRPVQVQKTAMQESVHASEVAIEHAMSVVTSGFQRNTPASDIAEYLKQNTPAEILKLFTSADPTSSADMLVSANIVPEAMRNNLGKQYLGDILGALCS